VGFEGQATFAGAHRPLGQQGTISEEAFKATIEGAYYGGVISEMRRKGRLGSVPHEPGYPVNTSWDLGMNDSMSIWFFQDVGRERRIIDYYENSGEGLEHYARELSAKGYVYGTHYWPHDGSVRELGTGEKRETTAQKLGIRPIVTVPRPKNNDQLLDQIEETRRFLRTCWIDEGKCDMGIKHLEQYRKEWDDKLGGYKSRPLHDAASHGADGLRTGAVGHKRHVHVSTADLTPPALEDY